MVQQPLYGYALVQQIQQASHDLLRVEEASLYPALQRMLKEGLVTAKWGVSSTNRRVHFYRLTTAGVRHLRQEVSRFEQMLEGHGSRARFTSIGARLLTDPATKVDQITRELFLPSG